MSGRPSINEGQRLAGRYRVERVIGRGGMAAVHAGYDETLHRRVAIKTMLGQLGDDETFVERFRREARAAAGLNHPNIVSVHDIGSHDGLPFIVMELVHGEPLDRLLAGEPLPRERALQIATDVCAALAYAHQAGVVHRDVKPGNILIGDGGTVKVADFGIARAAGFDTITLTSLLGTAAYLSPEQASDREVDHRSDLYSLGVVLYELVTGQVPFGGGSAVQVALRHVADAPPRPSELAPDLDPDLEAVILKALAKDPADRYVRADALRRDLLALRDGVPVGIDHAAALAAAGGVPPLEATRVAAASPPSSTLVLPDVDAADTVAWPEPGEPTTAPGPPAPRAELSTTPIARAPGGKRRRSRAWLSYFAVGLVGVLGLLAVGVLARNRPVAVPDLQRLTVDEARAALSVRGLTVQRVDERPDATVPGGEVVAQSIRPCETVPPGTAMVITVSTGSPPAPSPPPADLDDHDDEEDDDGEGERDGKDRPDKGKRGRKGKE